MGAYVSRAERQRKGNERAQRERERNYNAGSNVTRQPGLTGRNFLEYAWSRSIRNR